MKKLIKVVLITALFCLSILSVSGAEDCETIGQNVWQGSCGGLVSEIVQSGFSCGETMDFGNGLELTECYFGDVQMTYGYSSAGDSCTVTAAWCFW